MLKITVTGDEFFDEESKEFVTRGDVVLELEHSLVSLSKWESEFEKPFLGAGEKTEAEIISYIKVMVLTPEFPPEVFSRFSQSNFDDVNTYLNRSQSATWFSDQSKPKASSEVITSELIYYWMFTLTIPIECESWPLNRLLTLIRIFDVKNSKPKKMSPQELARQRQQLNEQRRQQLKSSG